MFIEKHRHVAEIQVKHKIGTFSGTEETGDLYVSIDSVVDKLEKLSKPLTITVPLRAR